MTEINKYFKCYENKKIMNIIQIHLYKYSLPYMEDSSDIELDWFLDSLDQFLVQALIHWIQGPENIGKMTFL